MQNRKRGIDPEKGIKYLPLFYLSIGIIFGSYAIYLFPLVSGENSRYDLPNLTTLIIEIAFGIAITFTVYLYAKRQHKENQNQQKKIEDLIIDIQKIEGNQQKIIDEQKQFKKRRHNFAINSLRSYLPNIEFLMEEIEKWKKKQTKLEVGDIDFVSTYISLLNNDIRNLNFQISTSADVLEPHHVDKLRQFLEIISDYAKFTKTVNLEASLPNIKNNVRDLLKELPNPPI